MRSHELAEVFAREKPEYVCHLAAQMNVYHSVQAPLYDADVNIMGSLNVIENCVCYDVRTVVFPSSAGAVYGELESLPVSEDRPSRAACHYGVSKYAVRELPGPLHAPVWP
ncbi:MAG: GDP-mannose 4,6-dehydratase [Candidatus Hydrogenedentes bacterium]|nr:GDP-mannose 4,6-dehydratase [Candidatus Hydrogenedentota bacterium]